MPHYRKKYNKRLVRKEKLLHVIFLPHRPTEQDISWRRFLLDVCLSIFVSEKSILPSRDFPSLSLLGITKVLTNNKSVSQECLDCEQSLSFPKFCSARWIERRRSRDQRIPPRSLFKFASFCRRFARMI